MSSYSYGPGMSLPVPIPGKPDLDSFYQNKSRSVPQEAAPEIRAYWAGTPYPLGFSLPGNYNPTGTVTATGLASDPLSNPAFGPWTQVGLVANQDFIASGVVGRAIWTSPLFDLRPDLKASHSYMPNAYRINRSAAFGAGAKLMCQTYGHDTIVGNQDIAVYSVEYGHISEPQNIRWMQKRQEVTSDFFDNADGPEGCSILEIQPAGGSSPIRYWGVTLIFDIMDGALLDAPTFVTTGTTQ